MKRLLFVLFLSAAGYAQPRLQIFQLNNRPAAATVDMVRQVLSPTGTVLPEERLNKLLVRDDPAALERVQKLLDQIDQPAPQVRITVNSNGQSPQSGSMVSVGPGGVAAGAYDTRPSAAAQQNLLVMSGESGHIMVGHDIINVQPYWQYASGLGLLAPGVVFQKVSTGFAVQPNVIGDSVRLRITPWMSYESAGGRGQVEIAEAATTVTLRAGETTTIAASSGRSSRSGNAFGLILGSGTESRGQDSQISVSAEIVPSGP